MGEAGGKITVEVNGFITESAEFQPGQNVIDKCYSKFGSISIKNPRTPPSKPDAWVGEIQVTKFGSSKDLSLMCQGCENSKFNGQIVVTGGKDDAECNEKACCLNGKKCIIKVKDQCHPNPCKNKGTCQKLKGKDYDCKCKPGWGGEKCEIKKCNGGTEAQVGDCCTASKKCKEGQGNCKNDDECLGDLVCGENNCGQGFYDKANCCEPKPKETLYWVDDGCQTDTGGRDEFKGVFQSVTSLAFVRCCSEGSEDGTKCKTISNCKNKSEMVNYAKAVSECQEWKMRLCTKDEIFKDVCCGNGNGCDDSP